MSWSDKIDPTVRRLTVAGNFAEGITLSAASCKELAKGLKLLAAEADRRDDDELRRWAVWQVAKPCLQMGLIAAVLLFAGWVFNG